VSDARGRRRSPKPGDQVSVSIFADGERVDVIGTSRGKGFQGVVKRHHFAGGARRTGRCSTARPARSAPRRFPRASSRDARWRAHGRAARDVRNLKVLRVDAENNLLLVEGAVPGGPNSVVVIRKAVAAKKLKVAQVETARREEVG
jgi:large subunit ribosomal protein L3